MNQIYLTIPEAAEALNLNPFYVYKLAQSGEIPGVKRFGRAVRVHRETLENWARNEAQGDQSWPVTFLREERAK